MVFIKVLLVAAFCIYQGVARCTPWSQIKCKTNDKCVHIYDLCNGWYDCDDKSDEEDRLCSDSSIWGKTLCTTPGTLLCKQGDNKRCLPARRYCTSSNLPCEDRDERLCQMFNDGKLIPYDEIVVRSNVFLAEISGQEFHEKFNVTIEHPDCPHLYTRVGDHCLSFFFFGLVNWGEARSFCKMNGGDLLTFQDGVGTFYEIVRHLREHNITSDFWVGGAVRNKTWTWVDGNPIELGTPYWSLRTNPDCQHLNQTVIYEKSCNQYLQRPLTPVVGMCAALTFENFFYMSDEDCLTKKSPLCVAGKEPTVKV
ncbi:uncharacterized protein LOC119572302 [Penaeus monodon]|uniref:uncharacterized protein LOC119572302 n=1 Tax=Penaeus monodon TaxID=6687 RepID=UPI0018A6FE1B|nr:uncharacterized protein LOC119572302 [Penaeus monodon]